MPKKRRLKGVEGQVHANLMNAPSVGAFIRLARLRMGLTLQQAIDRLKNYAGEVGNDLRLSPTMLSLIEKGERMVNNNMRVAMPIALKLNGNEAAHLKRLWDNARDADRPNNDGAPSVGDMLDRLERRLRKAQRNQRDVLLQQLGDLLDEQEQPAVRAKQARVQWAVIPVAGWQAQLLSDDYTARLIAPCIREAAKCGIHNFLLIMRNTQTRLLIFLQDLMKASRTRHFHFEPVIQNKPAGLGATVQLSFRALSTQDAIALLLPDDHLRPGCLKSLLQLHKRNDKVAVALRRTRESEKFNGVAYGQVSNGEIRIEQLAETSIIDKGRRDSFYILGRYVLDRRLLKALTKTQNDQTDTLQLTDALNWMSKVQPESIGGVEYDGPINSVSDYRRKIMNEIDRILGHGTHGRKKARTVTHRG